MILDCYKIWDNLFQGPVPPEGDLVASGFDVLVLCAWENQDPIRYPGVEVINAPGDDLINGPIDSQELENWRVAAAITVTRLREGKRVLVTCMGGYNRSGMVSAMVMNQITGWAMDDIIQHIKRKRPGALHNPSFTRWLSENLKESGS